MKKFFVCIFLAATMLFASTLTIYAAQIMPSASLVDDEETVITYEDGSTLTISSARIVEEQTSTIATAKTITADKEATFTNASGTLEWKYTLTATFSYVSGVSSTCTNTYYTQNIYASGWTFSEGSATKSGNEATGKGKYVKKILFVTVKTYNINISLTCDNYGNLT